MVSPAPVLRDPAIMLSDSVTIAVCSPNQRSSQNAPQPLCGSPTSASFAPFQTGATTPITLMAYSVEFVAAPEEAGQAQSAIPSVIDSAFHGTPGFSGCIVAVLTRRHAW